MYRPLLIFFLCCIVTLSQAQVLYGNLSIDSVFKTLAHTEIDSHLYHISPETQAIKFRGASIGGYHGTYSVEFGGTDSIILFQWVYSVEKEGRRILISPKAGADIFCYLKDVLGEPKDVPMSGPEDKAKCFRWHEKSMDPPLFYQLSISNYYVKFCFNMYDPYCPDN